MNSTFSNTTSTSSDPIIPDDLGVYILRILLIIVIILCILLIIVIILCILLKNKHNCDAKIRIKPLEPDAD